MSNKTEKPRMKTRGIISLAPAAALLPALARTDDISAVSRTACGRFDLE